MDLDALFHSLADPIRRRLIEELAERDGQTLFELHVRLISWHGAQLSRQGLSKHLSVLEKSELIRVEWKWRSKYHFFNREPLAVAWKRWVAPQLSQHVNKEGIKSENSADKHHGG